MKTIVSILIIMLLAISTTVATSDLSLMQKSDNEVPTTSINPSSEETPSSNNDMSNSGSSETKKDSITLTKKDVKTKTYNLQLKERENKEQYQEYNVPQPADIWCDALLGVFEAYFDLEYTCAIDVDKNEQVNIGDLVLFTHHYFSRDNPESQNWCHQQVRRGENCEK